MVSDIKTRLYYKARSGKYKGRFVPLNFKNKSLIVKINVSGMGQKQTYEIDWRPIAKKFKGKRMTEDLREVFKDYFKEQGTKRFLKTVSVKNIKWNKDVIVGNRKPSVGETASGTRFQHRDLTSDVKVNWGYEETPLDETWTFRYETSYENHPTFLHLALGVNQFNNPARYSAVHVRGVISYNSALARGMGSNETVMRMSETKGIPFKFEFFDKLFKVKDYWLIPPDHTNKKSYDGITPVGMITYTVRELIEKMHFSISGTFQKRRVPFNAIKWYGVRLEITGVKAPDDKHHKKYLKQMQKIRQKMRDDKIRMEREHREIMKRARAFEKGRAVSVTKGRKVTGTKKERGFKSKKPSHAGRQGGRSSSQRKKR